MLSAKMHLETACGQTQRFSKKQEKCPQKTERMLVSTTEPTDAANLGDNQVREQCIIHDVSDMGDLSKFKSSRIVALGTTIR